MRKRNLTKDFGDGFHGTKRTGNPNRPRDYKGTGKRAELLPYIDTPTKDKSINLLKKQLKEKGGNSVPIRSKYDKRYHI